MRHMWDRWVRVRHLWVRPCGLRQRRSNIHIQDSRITFVLAHSTTYSVGTVNRIQDSSWKESEYRWPALAKMAKQYLAAPASSAGVERVFSAAGKMHGDLRKAMKDGALKHSIFAAFNTK